MNNDIKYSSLLQDFAQPLINGDETPDAVLQKLKVAELIWNHCVARENQLPIFDLLDKAINESNKRHPEMKIVCSILQELKKAEFNEYNNFIVKTEYRIKPDGSKTIYVESISPEMAKEIYKNVKV
jgi:hypothetical protein